MKSLVLFIFLGILLFVLSFVGSQIYDLYSQNKSIIDPIASLTNSPSPTKLSENHILDIDIDSKLYRIAWYKAKPSNIKLYSNLEQEEKASNLYKAKRCQALVNGGFYDKEGKHIGLLVSEEKQIKEWKQNQLFNGVFSISKDELAQIEKMVLPNQRLALQSGPMLFANSKAQPLFLAQDIESRRSVVTIIENKDVLFLTIYDPKSAYLGPKLEDMAKILQEVEKNLNVKITAALNLDGGSASAFFTEGVSLGELTKIGSYFCVM